MADSDLFAPDYDAPIEYMRRTREYYLALGYDNPYRWAHYVDAPFQPLKKPLKDSTLALITTAAPYQPDKGDQGVLSSNLAALARGRQGLHAAWADLQAARHDARTAIGDGSKSAAFDRMKRKVAHAQAHSQAKSEIAADDMEERLAALEKEDRIEQLLAELKTKRGV